MTLPPSKVKRVKAKQPKAMLSGYRSPEYGEFHNYVALAENTGPAGGYVLLMSTQQVLKPSQRSVRSRVVGRGKKARTETYACLSKEGIENVIKLYEKHFKDKAHAFTFKYSVAIKDPWYKATLRKIGILKPILPLGGTWSHVDGSKITVDKE